MDRGTWIALRTRDSLRSSIDRDSPSVLGDMTGTTGRCIEGLVEFYDATGDALALELADEMARYHLEHSTAADGSMPPAIVDPGNAGHSHSYLGTLRGLARFGWLTRQHRYVDAVAGGLRRRGAGSRHQRVRVSRRTI